MRYILLSIAILACLTGCYYDHANLVYPQATGTCTVTNVTYSTNVTGILSANCYSCHSGNAAAGGGIKLDSYTALKVYLTNGQLSSSINQNGSVPSMPLNGGKLSACDINTIQVWISNGTPNN